MSYPMAIRRTHLVGVILGSDYAGRKGNVIESIGRRPHVLKSDGIYRQIGHKSRVETAWLGGGGCAERLRCGPKTCFGDLSGRIGDVLLRRVTPRPQLPREDGECKPFHLWQGVSKLNIGCESTGVYGSYVAARKRSIIRW